MIRYFETSALVKLLVVEPDSDLVHGLFRESSARAVHEIAYVEMHSALSRKARTDAVDPAVVSDIRDRIDSLWGLLDRVRVAWRLLQEAARLTADHPLPAYDSLHLASVLRLSANTGEEPFEFVCFDTTLRRAAETEGIRLSPSD